MVTRAADYSFFAFVLWLDVACMAQSLPCVMLTGWCAAESLCAVADLTRVHLLVLGAVRILLVLSRGCVRILLLQQTVVNKQQRVQ